MSQFLKQCKSPNDLTEFRATIETIAKAFEKSEVVTDMRGFLQEILDEPFLFTMPCDSFGVEHITYHGHLIRGSGVSVFFRDIDRASHTLDLSYRPADVKGLTTGASISMGIIKELVGSRLVAEFKRGMLGGGGSIAKRTEIWAKPNPNRVPKQLILGIKEMFNGVEGDALREAIDVTREKMARFKRNPKLKK